MDGKQDKSVHPRFQYVEKWLEIGKNNPWIKYASDPPFTRSSFYFCDCIEELKKNFKHGNWCLGQAFCLDNLCFIQQVNGGDEWLTIKEDVAFESITMIPTIKRGKFKELIEDLQTATLEQCQNLEYRQKLAFPKVNQYAHRCNCAEEAKAILSQASTKKQLT